MSLKDEVLKDVSARLEGLVESFAAYVEYALNEKKVELDEAKVEVEDETEEDEKEGEDKDDADEKEGTK